MRYFFFLFLFLSLTAHAQNSLFGSKEATGTSFTPATVKFTNAKYKSADTSILFMTDTAGNIIPITIGTGIKRKNNILYADTSVLATVSSGSFIKNNVSGTAQTASAFINGTYSTTNAFVTVNGNGSNASRMAPQYIEIRNGNGGLMGFINGQSLAFHIVLNQAADSTGVDLSADSIAGSTISVKLPKTSGRLALTSQLLNGVTNDTNTILGNYSYVRQFGVTIGNGINGLGIKSIIIGDSGSAASGFNTVIGYKAISTTTKGGSVLIGALATDSTSLLSSGFVLPVIIGYNAHGNGTNLGAGTLTLNGESIAIGPYTKNTERAGAAIAIGDNVHLYPNFTGTATHHDTCGGCVIIGDVTFGYNWLNYFIGGGAGMGHNYGACFACQGSSVGWTLDVMTADHQGFFGWYDKTSSAFAGNIGFINDIWLGGPVTSTVLHPITWNISSAEGTNQAGTDLTINASAATGNAATGTIKLNTSDVGSSGTTLQAQTTKLQIGTTNTSNTLMNYGSDLSGSYTTRSMIDKGYGTATYGTLSQQNINTANIATNTSNIATNTANIATNTSALATKWSLSGNTGSGNILGQTDDNGFLVLANGDTLFYVTRHAITFDSTTTFNAPANSSIMFNSATKTQTSSGTAVGSFGSIEMGKNITIANSSLTSEILKINAKIATSSGNGYGVFIVDTITGATSGRISEINMSPVINVTTGTPIINGINITPTVVANTGSIRVYSSSFGAGAVFYQDNSAAWNQYAGKSVFGSVSITPIRAVTIQGACVGSDSGQFNKIYSVSPTIGSSTDNVALYNTTTKEVENSGVAMSSFQLASSQTDNNTTLTAGVGTSIVSDANITSGSLITMSYKSISLVSGAAGSLTYTLNAGVGFTITSSVGVLDNGSVVTYHIKY